MADEGTWVDVQQGESVESIAYRFGHITRTLWDHAENKALCDLRKDPHTLLPGDRLFVPPPRVKVETIRTGAVHQFVLNEVPSRLTMYLRQGPTILADLPYDLYVENRILHGQTNADGAVSVPVMPDVDEAYLVVDPEGRSYTFLLYPRHLDPVTETPGLQGRLRNLGYYIGPIDGLFTAETLHALLDFQHAQGLDPTGQPDDATRARLMELHGC